MLCVSVLVLLQKQSGRLQHAFSRLSPHRAAKLLDMLSVKVRAEWIQRVVPSLYVVLTSFCRHHGHSCLRIRSVWELMDGSESSIRCTRPHLIVLSFMSTIACSKDEVVGWWLAPPRVLSEFAKSGTGNSNEILTELEQINGEPNVQISKTQESKLWIFL